MPEINTRIVALIPASLLLVTSVSILALRWLRPKFSFYWLVSLCGILLTWVSNLVLRNWIPIILPITSWLSEELFSASLILIFDQLSWIISLALLTFTLSVILTDIVHPVQEDYPRSNWFEIAGWTILPAVGLMAIMAGNLLTLLMAWVSLDLMEFTFWFTKARERSRVDRVVYNFSTRICSLFFIIWSLILVNAKGQVFSWEGISPQVTLFIIIAVILRSGVLPIRSPLSEKLAVSRSTRILFRLVPSFTSLAILPRLAHVDVPPPFSYGLLALLAISALASGLSWVNSKDEMEGLSFWISGIAALSIAAAIYNNPASSLTWTMALLLLGGILFCFSVRAGWLLVIPFMSALMLTGLPFTLTWQAMAIFAPPFTIFKFLIIISQSLLLAGYLKHSWRRPSISPRVDRWFWIVIPWGIGQLLILQIVISRWLSIENAYISEIPLTWNGLWPGIVVCILGVSIFTWTLQGRDLFSKPESVLAWTLSFEWIYPILSGLFRFFSRIFRFMNIFIEGEPGVLWAALVLILLLSLLSQVWSGG